jgi:hypothetical protein
VLMVFFCCFLRQTRGCHTRSRQYGQLRFLKSCSTCCPIRAAHCRTRGFCGRRRDHQCPWTGNCVGCDNTVAFVKYASPDRPAARAKLGDCDAL